MVLEGLGHREQERLDISMDLEGLWKDGLKRKREVGLVVVVVEVRNVMRVKKNPTI